MSRRKNKAQQSRIMYIVLLLVVVAALSPSLVPQSDEPAASVAVENNESPLTLGDVRSEALPYELPASRDGELVVEHTGFVVAFNTTTLCPKYVAWQLTDAEADGSAATRTNDFLPDPLLPHSCQVTTDDYKGSGYDRGHMVPAADMKWSAEAMRECFYMSNMCPQNHNLNAGSWQTLEEACRQWARSEGCVYIACGPIFRGKRHKTIGRNHIVTVPEAFFKVVLSMRSGQEKAIGFIYNNESGRQTMAQTAVSVDEVERITGIDFFAALPDDMEQRLESQFSMDDWQ